jgi:hypothetical protein
MRSQFAFISEPGSLLKPQAELEAYVQELYGDFRLQQPRAVLTIRFILFKEEGRAHAALSDKVYTQAVALSEKTAAATVAGWNQALREIVSHAAADLNARLGAHTPGAMIEHRSTDTCLPSHVARLSWSPINNQPKSTTKGDLA